MENQFPFDENQLVISFELLSLINWIVKHQPETVRRLVENLLKTGLQEKLAKQRKTDLFDEMNLQESIVEFFGLFEQSLVEATEARSINQPSPQALAATIESIDSSSCDHDIIALSAQRTTRALKRNVGQDAKDLFYKELLKSWNPRNKRSYH
ncbi:TPA: hypothetical protein DDZ86_03555 [Candidatus Dependentiae bacterium]|nr:MAG: hypothetical protein UW09_C0003G0063 [candidate division TM6 bacterium GW2011_GWF2_43_87]HBL98691.1 hypothetical protein [Candidatus Dependentiae bacterium]